MVDHDSDIGEANEMLVMPWHRVFTPNVAESGYSDLAVSKVRFHWCLGEGVAYRITISI